MTNQEIIDDLLVRMQDADWHKREPGTVERDTYEWLKYTYQTLTTLLDIAGITWEPKGEANADA